MQRKEEKMLWRQLAEETIWRQEQQRNLFPRALQSQREWRGKREPITRLTFLFVWLNTSLSGVSQLESRPQKEKKSRVKKGQIDTVAPSSTRWRSSGLARMQAPVEQHTDYAQPNDIREGKVYCLVFILSNWW